MRTPPHTAAGRHTVLGLLVLAALALAGWISTVAINGVPWSSPYELRLALPQGAPLLTAGDDVRVAGERVGQVSSVSLAKRGDNQAVATLSISDTSIYRGATARIRPRGLAGAVYVDLYPGLRRDRALPSGSLLHTVSGGVELTNVIAGFDGDARHAMQAVLTQTGNGLAGRGVAVNQSIAQAPSLLANTTAALHAVDPEPGALSGVIGSADTVSSAVAPPGDQTLAGIVSDARAALSATGGLPQTIAALPGTEHWLGATLPGADTLLTRATTAARDLTPGVRALAQALPGLKALERASPAVNTLGEVAHHAAPVFSALILVLGELRGTASGLTPLTDPVTELANVLIPYRQELVQAPLGFTRWGNFSYDFGTGSGHRAVRFTMVFTCGLARDPYPKPGEAATDRKACQ
jgi:phospholipid/cholesterol/gamma-HCH transport system substrate-binding protein